MVLRNVAKTFSLEQQRQEINLIAADLHNLSQVAETDPVFGASPSSGITSQKIANWDLAYSWGNHALSGYATETFVINALTNINNWDTAYGWGDHSTAGYLTSNAIEVSDSEPTTPSNGDLWWKSDTGVLKIYYTDVDTSQWVDASPTSASATSPKVLTADVPPPNPVNGDLWWKSDTGVLKIWWVDSDSAQWVDASPAGGLGGGGGAGPLTSISIGDDDGTRSKSIKLGDDDDLTLFYDGRTGYVTSFIESDQLIIRPKTTPSDTFITFLEGGPVQIYHGSSTRISTSSTGVSIFGALTAGGLTYPTTNGSSGQVLTSDATGNVNWTTLSSGAPILHANVAAFPPVGTSESIFAYADDTGSMYYSNGVSWTSQRLVTTNDITTSDFATLLGATQLTYTINALDHTGGTTVENDNRKVIRLEDSSGTTDQIVLVAGDGISINRTGDEIELVNDVANSTYSISAENATGAADTLFVLTDNAGATDGIKFAGADGLTVERTDENTITFRAPSGASGGTYTAEDAQDAASQLFVNGTHTGISFTYNDANNTIDATVTGGGGGGTTYDLLGSNTTSNNAILTLRDANNNDDSIEFIGSNGTDIAWDSVNNRITINSTAPVQPDWDATSGLGEILNKPTIPSEYTLPVATTSTLGGVIPDGTTITIDANGNIAAAAGGYVLPTASATVLGGIKIGSGLSIDGNGVVNATGGSTVPQIQDLTGTTGSVADNNTTELNITGYKAYALFKITVDTEAWVRVYVDDASRDADLTRSEGQDPTPGSGVIAEVRTSGAESILTSPGIMGFNNDNPRTDNIYLSVTNRSGNPTPITVTLTALQIGE